ncbi:hypothetical protein [Flavobacterium sp.]|uniref:hypothetical protein n=1 Tax=Flavobacterium sp. TaxID=239 RepID=UPI003A9455E3
MIIAYFELIVTLIHCLLLSLLYSGVLLLVILLIAKTTNFSFISGITSRKLPFWFSCIPILFVILVLYRFSYERDNGLGETVMVPIGYKQHVFCSDGGMVYFYPNPDAYDSEDFDIGKFTVSQNKLCAEVIRDYSNSPDYDFIVYNLEKKTSIPLNTIDDYTQYAQANNLPLTDEFKAFSYHYKKFTIRPKWRIWLLP